MKGFDPQSVRVRINMAMTVDGKVTTFAREPSHFTSAEDRVRLMEIRSWCDAILVGGTTAKDYETMGIASVKLQSRRLRRQQSRHPVRVIVSGRLKLSPKLKVFRSRISPLLIVCTSKASLKARKQFSSLARVEVCGDEEVDFTRLFDLLRKQYGCRNVLCEGGPTLNDALFRSGWVDEVSLTLCPWVFGGRKALTLAEGKGFPSLSKALRGNFSGLHPGETDYFLTVRLPRRL